MNGQAKGPAMTADPLTLSGGTLEGASQRVADIVKPVGAIRTDDHRYYWNDRGPLPSVTSILDVINRPAISEHNSRETARALLWALREGWLAEYDAVADEDGIIGWAKAQPRQQMEDAGNVGTSVHLLADFVGRSETAPTGFTVDERVIPYLEGWRAFLVHLTASGGQILSSEHYVYSLSDGYAGTYDLILEYRGARWMVDVKTSRGYYPEYALQLAGYGYAEFVGLPDDPTRYSLPPIQRYGVLHLRPDLYTDTGWRLIEYPVTDRDYRAFLAALDLYQWQKEGRFRKSILQKAIDKGELTGIGLDPLTTESTVQE